MIINSYIYGVATSYDADAQLFFNAQTGAGVTLTTTQMNAVNQWVVDAKSAGIWTKMKAVYPIVGGTATSHKFNLKNPLDTNAAFRLAFSGGGTHSANGYQPGGVNGFANTFFAPSVNSAGINDFHSSYYSRSDVNLTQVEMGCGSSDAQGTLLEIRTANVSYIRINAPTTTSFADTDSLGFYSQSRLLGNTQKGYKNAALKVTGTVNSNTTPTQNFYIGAYNSNGTPFYYTSKECAFATIGDGLTDLESQLFYQITEKYQVALSRNINTTQSFYYNSAYNNETNAFLFSTQITDATIQTATNTLVSDLKTAGIYTKMKAIYPMVGGTATTHKYNLINPQDSDAAFRLVFSGGWTHSANGALPNGTNAYASTFLIPNTVFGAGFASIGIYINQALTVGATIIGSTNMDIQMNTTFVRGLNKNTTNILNSATLPMTGFIVNSRTTSTNAFIMNRSGTFVTNATAAVANYATTDIVLGATNSNGTINGYSTGRIALAFSSDFLTQAESTVLKSIVQAFNTTLGRQVI